MAKRSQWLLLLVLGGGALSAGFLATTAFSQATPTSADTSSAIPYTTSALPEITKLKPASNSPTSVEDLRAIQARVEAVVQHVLPAVVAISITSGNQIEQGSGVIVSKDGYVLTAGHVSGEPHTRLSIIMSNGNTVLGEALGAQTDIDSGMIKIDTSRFPADYPFVPLGESSSLVAGEWVVDLGHPGGYQKSRPPVVRIGRVLKVPDPRHGDPSRDRTPYIRTDCQLIMGDSGGPLFDLDGRLVGINSRIGLEVDANIHVPIDTFKDHWTRLASAQMWKGDYDGLFAGRGPARASQAPAAKPAASLGAAVAADLRILQIFDGGAAERAHLDAGDVITKINGKAVKTREDLAAVLQSLVPGKSIAVEYLRDNKSAEVSVTLLAAPSP